MVQSGCSYIHFFCQHTDVGYIDRIAKTYQLKIDSLTHAEKLFAIKKILGGKGSGLFEMSAIGGINIPAGFVVDTSVCIYHNQHKEFPLNFDGCINDSLKQLEQVTGKYLNDPEKILLLSVRSGAPISMPGMMDTILNIGITKDNLAGLIVRFGAQFALNCYLRFLECYADLILEIDFRELMIGSSNFGCYLDQILRSEERFNFDEQKFTKAIAIFEELISANGFEQILHDVHLQIKLAIKAVVKSYCGKRACVYREANNLDQNMGTAVIIQSMVFGNLNENSGTGVLFSRDPSTGENQIFGEYMINAQGEDVVSGVCTPEPINSSEPSSMKNKLPHLYSELHMVAKKLEDYFKDVQDIEFTIEDGKLYILQTRSAKRCAEAELKIAFEFLQEGLIDERELLKRVQPQSLDKMLHPIFKTAANVNLLTKGLPASPGCAVGKIVFDSNEAAAMQKNNLKKEKIILVRNDTSPEDIMGMIAAEGILTARGGMTSHAAVVARGMGKPCVCGAMELLIYDSAVGLGGDAHGSSSSSLKYLEIHSADGKKVRIYEGEIISINGSTGEVFLGEIEVIEPEINENFASILNIAQKNSKLSVRANADNEQDCKNALRFNAKGIGLCRTEHMFFAEDKIFYIRKMIFSECEETRKQALVHIKEFQKQDFIKIFLQMAGLDVTIRLLDPPLHEFLPLTEQAMQSFAELNLMPLSMVREKIAALSEKNPMLGHRGCRLAISYPEIYIAQVEAIFEAIFELITKHGLSAEKILPEIMIPLIAWEKECEIMVGLVHQAAKSVFKKFNFSIAYKVGSMIELPRATLIADKIAAHVDFLSFGTNDLTQTTLGISRDDMISFLNDYINADIIGKTTDPFVQIDPQVAVLMEKAISLARSVKPGIKIGVCGEHAGNPYSIRLFGLMGADYVSCSPYRLPMAQLAAAKIGL